MDSQHLFHAKQLSVSIKVTYTFFRTALKKVLRVWSINKKQSKKFKKESIGIPGADPEIFKREGGEGGGRALSVGYHGWPTKKILGLRWSKKGKNDVRNYFLTNYFLTHWRIFKLCPFLHNIKAWWWNIIKLLNFTNTFKGDTQDVEDARLIVTSAACKWLQKIVRARAKAFRDDILEITVIIKCAN